MSLTFFILWFVFNRRHFREIRVEYYFPNKIANCFEQNEGYEYVHSASFKEVKMATAISEVQTV